jgi:hypothetical protein
VVLAAATEASVAALPDGPWISFCSQCCKTFFSLSLMPEQHFLRVLVPVKHFQPSFIFESKTREY